MFFILCILRLFGIIDANTWNTYLIIDAIHDATDSVNYHIDRHEESCEERHQRLLKKLENDTKKKCTKRIRRIEKVDESGFVRFMEEVAVYRGGGK
ncbi:MAG: hypothetical protein NC041_06465 [Bacteroides sp.]|nr:hypothetical protein [Prevotella sp.]MCM1406939.1 hypothetical protein [Treponema brennaborense]MCM1470090.1 hypothetical protein [Bacteroides sp.]